MSIPTLAKVIEIYRGTWVADITTADVPTGVFDMGERTWTGTVIPQGYIQDGSRYHARIVGGAGKLGTALREQEYRGAVTIAQVARDILTACGEKAGTIDGKQTVSYYERSNGTAGECLNELCDATGLVWWVDRDGLVNLTAARTTVAAIDPTKCPQIGADVDGSVTLNVVTADDVQPGMLAGDKAARALYWRLSSGALVVECSPIQPSIPDTRGATFYTKLYGGKVDKFNEDDTVDVIADARFRLTRVPLLPGVVMRTTLKPGERVVVGFLGANRSAPFAMPGQISGGAAKSLVLDGDTVTMLLPPFAFEGFITTPSGPLPATGVMTALTGQTLGTAMGSSVRNKSE